MLTELFHSPAEETVTSKGCKYRRLRQDRQRLRFVRGLAIALTCVLFACAVGVSLALWQHDNGAQSEILEPVALFVLSHLRLTLGVLSIGPLAMLGLLWRSQSQERAHAEALKQAREKRETIRVSFHQLRHVFTSLPVPYFLTHMDGRLIQGNPDALYAFGLGPEALSKENLFDLIGDQDCAQALKGAVTAHRRFDGGEICLPTVEGGKRWFLVAAARVEVNQRHLLFVTFSDMTGQKLAEHASHTNESALRDMIEASPMPTIIFRRETDRIEYINRSAKVFFDGVDMARIGNDASNLWETRIQYRAFVNEMLESRSLTDQEMRLKGRDGAVMWVQGSMTVLSHNNQDMVCCSFADITARKEKECELLRLATTDPLTGAMNRRAFHDQCLKEYARAQRGGYPLTLISCDLDHFKQINDCYGHATGDEVLCQFTHVLGESLRPGDVYGRIGGEEFAILLPGATVDLAAMVAVRIQSKMMNMGVQVPAVTEIAVGNQNKETSVCLEVTASFGLALWQAEQSLENTLAQADEALYEAKSAGRNCIRVTGVRSDATANEVA